MMRWVKKWKMKRMNKKWTNNNREKSSNIRCKKKAIVLNMKVNKLKTMERAKAKITMTKSKLQTSKSNK